MKAARILIPMMVLWMWAMTAFAVDVDFSGEFYIRYYMYENPTLTERGTSDEYFDTKFQLKTMFQLHENLSLVTRFDALERKWGTSDEAPDAENNIDFDHAYALIKTPAGIFQLGRQKGGCFGLDFGDTEMEADQLKWVLPLAEQSVFLTAIYQKSLEKDSIGTDRPFTDTDHDTIYIGGEFKQEHWGLGLFYEYSRRRDESEIYLNINGQIIRRDINYHALIPYINLNLPITENVSVGFMGEAMIEFGKESYDANSLGFEDRDISAVGGMLQGSFTFGPITIEGGWAHIGGQENGEDATSGNIYYGGIGEEWGKMLIFTDPDADGLLLSTDANVYRTDIINLGVDMIWGAIYCQPLDNLTISFLVATADTNKNPEPLYSEGGWRGHNPAARNYLNFDSDNYGTEYDLGLEWNIVPNLTYELKYAFLDAGDVWKYLNGTGSVDDTFTIYQKLVMEF